MNLIVFEDNELEGDGSLILSGERAKHISHILGAKPGDVLRVGMLGAGVGSAVVAAIDGDQVVLCELRLAPVESPSPVNLIVAMPRPQTLKKILQISAAMGVHRLMLVRAARVEKSYFSTPVLEPKEIRKHLRLGLEQGISTHIPEVSVHDRFTRFIRAELAENIFENENLLTAHPRAEHSLCELGLDSALASQPSVTFAVGPEGGWMEHECSMMKERGFRLFACGPWVLRVETAASVLLGQLELLRRQAAKN